MNPTNSLGISPPEAVSRRAVVVTQLAKALGGKQVLESVSFEASPGEIFGLLGPNGAGKTTTLRLISTLIAPDQGHVNVAGFDAHTHPREIRRQIGMVSGDLGVVYPRLTVRENLAYMARLCGIEGVWLRKRVDRAIEHLRMEDIADKRCELLSAGERQRVAIARAIVHDPEVLIFDEPTSNLDVPSSLIVREFMAEARDEGKCVLFSTHVLSDVERLCDRVGILHKGRVVACGAPDEITRDLHASDFEYAFLMLIGARPSNHEGSEAEDFSWINPARLLPAPKLDPNDQDVIAL